MRFLYAALLISFLLVGCSKTSKEPKEDKLMLTPIEDLGFSHDVEADDGDWDGLEKVHAKFTAQWYVDPKGLAWNFENPGYVLREREVFLDGVCSVIKERDGDEWLIRLYGPGYNFEGDWPPGDYFLYLHKHITDGKPWYNISWNANFEGEAASRRRFRT